MNKLEDFKELFKEDLIWLESCKCKDDVIDLADMLFNSDNNYNNCDVTSCQCCYTEEEINDYLMDMWDGEE